MVGCPTSCSTKDLSSGSTPRKYSLSCKPEAAPDWTGQAMKGAKQERLAVDGLSLLLKRYV